MISLHKGLPPHLRSAAVVLYWQAFGGKLGTVMGPETKALRFLDRVLRADHCIYAVDNAGKLLGMVGFKTHEGSFAGGEIEDVRAIYGVLGSAWRLPLLWMLERDTDNLRFLLDGICVVREARGRGIGAALLAAIEAEAQERGYPAIRLDVIDNNFRAKALYTRTGYVVEKTDDIGVLRYAFGFQSSSTMVKTF
ncbi:MAG: GNAT family N-acetyltransferase [Cypionkella sp.]